MPVQRPIVSNSRVGDGGEDSSVRLERREHRGDLELVPFDLRVPRGPCGSRRPRPK